jgi:hypothetical protein
MELYKVLPKLWKIWSYAKFLPKNMEICEVLPKIWNYMKFCQKYKVMTYFCHISGVMASFAKNIKLCFSFAKFMKLCQVLRKIWRCVKFCEKYRVMF